MCIRDSPQYHSAIDPSMGCFTMIPAPQPWPVEGSKPSKSQKARCTRCLNWKKNSEKNFDPTSVDMVCKLCVVFEQRKALLGPDSDDKALRSAIKEERRTAKESWIGSHPQAQGYQGFDWGNNDSPGLRSPPAGFMHSAQESGDITQTCQEA
eukprot:TRINITY_DN2772_c0_g1_i1.p1 TRINITY_DN2772_c0_g1~~TRINITY_DN2772_c0_g1_i1.p1  ORF type:complete len:152 (+),score=40.15 TRINITY_DN2772_c0_g1_i1:89-544(+)